MRPLIPYFLCPILAVMSSMAAAQELLVETNSLSALGQAVRVYVHNVNLDSQQILPLPMVLPGGTPLGPMMPTADGSAVFLSTADPELAFGHNDSGTAFTSILAVAPFRLIVPHALVRDPAWRHVDAALADSPSGPMLMQLESRTTLDGETEGRLTLYPIPSTRELEQSSPLPLTATLEWTLPGIPVKALPIEGAEKIAVLGLGPFGSGSWLHIVNALTGASFLEHEALLDPAGLAETDPGAIALSHDGLLLYVVTSGYATDSPAGDPVSWIRAYDTARCEVIGPPLELPGLIRPDDAVMEPDVNGGLWLATEWPIAGHAYVSHIALSGEGLFRDVSHSFTTTQSIHIAAEPAGDGAMVAIGERLERWDARGTLIGQSTYDAPIRVLRCTDAGLLVGEAGRLHVVDPSDGTRISTLQFQSGHVTDLVVAPNRPSDTRDADGDGLSDANERYDETNPQDADTDFDGIPDGIDVEPLRASPLLQVPASLVFRGESAGHDVKSISINAHLGLESEFEVVVPAEIASWLRVAPTSGRTPARVLVGIDPLHYRPLPDTTTVGWFDVILRSDDASRAATLSPQRVEVHVLPKATDTRRILWLWAEPASAHLRHATDPRGFKVLADLLAGAPYYFSHEEHAGPFSGPLTPFTIVVAPIDAAARGVVNPRELLDYIARGGAAMILGAHRTEFSPENLRWLRPLGFTIDPRERVDGIFTADADTGLLKDWNSISMVDGSMIGVSGPYEAMVESSSGTRQAVFAAKAYGRGRVAAIAAATPLESAAVARPSQRNVASALFGWLAEAGLDVADRDGDGLPDWQEDVNGNRAVDWGETNADRADSDGDGIPDGYEDANWNGVVDEGETNPRNPDSDGDGILDGADETPLPNPGAPMIDVVIPSSGPSEGGNEVVIGGAHLPGDSAIWFGPRQSARVTPLNSQELQALAPPSTSPGPVDVRLANARGTTIAVLPNAYIYDPPSTLRAVLRTVSLIEAQDGIYRGKTSISIEGPDIDLRSVRVYVRAEPADWIRWGEVTAGQAVLELGRRVTRIPLDRDAVAIDLHESPGRHRPFSGEIAVVTWDARATDDRPLTIVIDQAISRVSNGESIATFSGEPLQPLRRAVRPRRAIE